MAELVDALDSKSCDSNIVRVRFPLWAQASPSRRGFFLVWADLSAKSRLTGDVKDCDLALQQPQGDEGEVVVGGRAVAVFLYGGFQLGDDQVGR